MTRYCYARLKQGTYLSLAKFYSKYSVRHTHNGGKFSFCLLYSCLKSGESFVFEVTIRMLFNDAVQCVAHRMPAALAPNGFEIYAAIKR